jgi:DNA-binding NarL/FixJ family response regulator
MEAINIRSILSGRESEIMALVSAGKLNKEIADKLKCEETTIKKHLQHIYPKLEVQNRTEASIKFMEITGRIKPVTE